MSNKIKKWVFLGNEEKYYSEILNLDPEMVLLLSESFISQLK